MEIQDLLKSEETQILKLQEIVERAISEEQDLSTKIAEAERDLDLSPSALWADRIAKFGGSWKFILSFCFFIFLWICLNTLNIFEIFDPYPFILLNLILSCIAAIQAPIIMMAQNRQEQKDRRRSRNDYLVNLKAELEIRSINDKINLIIAEQMKSLFEIQKKQIEIMEEMKTKLHLLEKKSGEHP